MVSGEGGTNLPSEGLGVGRQTGGVPAVVTGELTLQVRGSLGEGAQELQDTSSYITFAVLGRPSGLGLIDIVEDKTQIRKDARSKIGDTRSQD